jgi:hypothetical protein
MFVIVPPVAFLVLTFASLSRQSVVPLALALRVPAENEALTLPVPGIDIAEAEFQVEALAHSAVPEFAAERVYASKSESG